MPCKLEELWILPEGPLRIERWRRVLRTTDLHFLLRCCAPTASKSVPTNTGESPNGQKSENSQSFKNTLQLNASQFWCSSEHLKAESGSSNDILKWLVPLSGLLMLIETVRDFEIANAMQIWETLNFAQRAKDREECFAPLTYIFFCAAARRPSLKVCQRTKTRAKCTKI